MAIRIVDPGPHKSVVKEIICQNCGATLEYTPGDEKEKIVRDYDMGVDITHYIVCPKCSKDVTTKRL